MIKRGIIFTLSVLIILSVLLQASGLSVVAQEETNNPFELYFPVIYSNTGRYPPVIPETTNVLTEDTTNYLTSVSSDGVIFTFSESTKELDSVSQGEIIASGVNSITPDGFLRKVKSFNLSGGEVILVTEPATLEDAIQQGSIHISQDLSPSMVQHAEQFPGVSLVSPLKEAPQGSFHIEINDVVLYDEDGNDQTTNDRVKANGSITIEPSFSFDMDMHNRQLEQLQLDFNATETSHLVVDSSVKVSVELIKKELARYPFAPTTIMVGPLPVVITPVLTVNVGLNGFIEIGVSAGVGQEASLNAGVRYQNNDWNPSSSFENQFQHNAPTVFQNVGFKGYTGAEVALMLYGIVGPQVEVNAYLKLESNPQVSPEWTLYGGLEVPIGVEIEIISKVIASYKVTAIKYEIILAQANTSNCNPGSTILDPASDVSLAHIDVTALSTILTGQTLQATFQIRDVPSNLTFNRIGVTENYVEYSWDVWVDTDNDSQTGCESSKKLGAEYGLSARHIAWTPNSPVTQPIESGVEANKWICDGTVIRSLEPIFLSVDVTSDTMILSGDIPGITTGSRIFFTTYDYNPDDYPISDLSSCAN